MPRFIVICLAGVSAVAATAAAQLNSQPPTPTTIALSSFFTVGPSGSLGQDGGFTNALGTAGTNPGWTLFTYGTAGGGGRFRINATSDSPASVVYWTATPTSPNTSAAALNFNAGFPGQWRFVTASSGTTAPIEVTVSNGATTYLPLNNPADLTLYNARLNEVFDFDAQKWIDPTTNTAIAPVAGSFEWTFANFDNGRYRSIDLVYTPVSEPAGLLALGVAVALGWPVMMRRAAR